MSNFLHKDKREGSRQKDLVLRVETKDVPRRDGNGTFRVDEVRIGQPFSYTSKKTGKLVNSLGAIPLEDLALATRMMLDALERLRVGEYAEIASEIMQAAKGSNTESEAVEFADDDIPF